MSEEPKKQFFPHYGMRVFVALYEPLSPDSIDDNCCYTGKVLSGGDGWVLIDDGSRKGPFVEPLSRVLGEVPETWDDGCRWYKPWTW